MPRDYFEQLIGETPTRVWVNNPTDRGDGPCPRAGRGGLHDEPGLRRQPAAACARRDPARSSRTASDSRTTTWWWPTSSSSALSRRIAERFLPLYEASGGHRGFVSIQGAPEARHGRPSHPRRGPRRPRDRAQRDAQDPGYRGRTRGIRDACRGGLPDDRDRGVQPRPARRHVRAVPARHRPRPARGPPFFMSPITGILGDHLKAARRSETASTVAAADMELAGVVLSRECYRLVEGTRITR